MVTKAGKERRLAIEVAHIIQSLGQTIDQLNKAQCEMARVLMRRGYLPDGSVMKSDMKRQMKKYLERS